MRTVAITPSGVTSGLRKTSIFPEVLKVLDDLGYDGVVTSCPGEPVARSRRPGKRGASQRCHSFLPAGVGLLTHPGLQKPSRLSTTFRTGSPFR